MSFQLENSHPQPTKSLSLLGGVSHDDVLVSTGIPVTLDLFQINKISPPSLKFQLLCPVSTRDTFLDSKNYQKRRLDDHHHHRHHHITMSRRNNNNNNVPKLDLKLNLSPPSSMMRINPNPNARTESPSRLTSVSPPSSCLSSEMSMSSPETTSMVLVGCPRCLMYAMLPEDDPKCPKCFSTVLLDFGRDNNNNDNDDNSNNNNCSNSSSSKKTRKG